MSSILDRLTEIAKKRLYFRTLETQNTDSADFQEVAVWSVKSALQEAYELGRSSVEKPSMVSVLVPAGSNLVDYAERVGGAIPLVCSVFCLGGSICVSTTDPDGVVNALLDDGFDQSDLVVRASIC